MTRKKPHIGSSFESWLDEQGIREEVTAAAIKATRARRAFSIEDVSPEQLAAIEKAVVPPEHSHLDAELKNWKP
jgi:hypothetical protein